jgi:hypothetical protein
MMLECIETFRDAEYGEQIAGRDRVASDHRLARENPGRHRPRRRGPTTSTEARAGHGLRLAVAPLRLGRFPAPRRRLRLGATEGSDHRGGLGSGRWTLLRGCRGSGNGQRGQSVASRGQPGRLRGR